MNKLVP